jgi:WD40 repeat-containing protein SMU1
MEWTVESADIIRLIQAFLTEQGLHQSCEVLREESGIGQVGVTSSSNLSVWCRTGQWDKVLSTLATLDPKRCFSSSKQQHQNPPPTSNNSSNKRKRSSAISSSSWALAEVHELAIAELAEVGALDVAYSLFKVVHNDLEKIPQQDNNDMWTTKARSLEQRLAAVAGTATASAEQKAKALSQLYGGGSGHDTTTTSTSIGSIKQERRTVLANYLVETIPELPRGRLPSLLQQAIKWQAHTGQLPWIREILEAGDDDEDENDDDDEAGKPHGQSLSKTKKKKKKKRAPKRLDLLLGAVEVEGFAVVGQDDSTNPRPGAAEVTAIRTEPIPTDPYSFVKFGKSATAECFLFLPDASGLVTGSSDGLIEIWDSASKFEKLRTDLPYQQPPNDDNDEGEANLLGHDDGSAVLAMAVSRDGTLLATGGKEGTIYVWRLDTGKCLRKMIAFSNPTAISCLDFVPDASRIIAGSTGPANACREFGLRTSRMLKEFSGHLSTLSTCHYVVVLARGAGSHGNEDDHDSANMSSSSGGDVLVVTGSLDGTILIWHGTTAEALRVLQPSSSASLVVRSSSLQELKINTSPAIVAVIQLPSYGTGQQQQRMIVVPRSTEAIMIDFMGTVLQRYSTAGSGIVATSTSTSTAKEMAASITTQNDEDLFVAACTSPSQKWLYLVTEQGLCHVFEVITGQWERTIREFALESTSRRNSKSDLADSSSHGRKFGLPEITGLIHHPHKGIVAAFSNDKTQKRGLVTLWK